MGERGPSDTHLAHLAQDQGRGYPGGGVQKTPKKVKKGWKIKKKIKKKSQKSKAEQNNSALGGTQAVRRYRPLGGEGGAV